MSIHLLIIVNLLILSFWKKKAVQFSIIVINFLRRKLWLRAVHEIIASPLLVWYFLQDGQSSGHTREMEMFPNALVTGIKGKKATKTKVLSAMGTLLQVIFLKILEYHALKMSIIWYFYTKNFTKLF